MPIEEGLAAVRADEFRNDSGRLFLGLARLPTFIGKKDGFAVRVAFFVEAGPIRAFIAGAGVERFSAYRARVFRSGGGPALAGLAVRVGQEGPAAGIGAGPKEFAGVFPVAPDHRFPAGGTGICARHQLRSCIED